MKYYTLIMGVYGTGKTSLIGILNSLTNTFGEIFYSDKIKLIEECLEKEICFTQETTLSGHWILKTVKRAVEKGYYVRLYYVVLNSSEESVERIKNRVQKGGHNIPDSDVQRKFDKRFEDLCVVLPYCNEATFYDNENGFVAVAEYKNGEILPIGHTNPAWLEELLNFYSSINET